MRGENSALQEWGLGKLWLNTLLWEGCVLGISESLQSKGLFRELWAGFHWSQMAPMAGKSFLGVYHSPERQDSRDWSPHQSLWEDLPRAPCQVDLCVMSHPGEFPVHYLPDSGQFISNFKQRSRYLSRTAHLLKVNHMLRQTRFLSTWLS